MEGSVSNVEVCNYAYTGQFDKLKQCILSDKTLACKIDQVKAAYGYPFHHNFLIIHLISTQKLFSGPPNSSSLGLFCWTHQYCGVSA